MVAGKFVYQLLQVLFIISSTFQDRKIQSTPNLDLSETRLVAFYQGPVIRLQVLVLPVRLVSPNHSNFGLATTYVGIKDAS